MAEIDESGVKPGGLRGAQVRFVRRDHHHLVGLQTQRRSSAKVNLRVGLVVMEVLRGQKALER